LRIQVIGFGNIGQGFAKVLLEKCGYLKEKYGIDPVVVSITDISGTAVSSDDEKGLDLKIL